jgi:hypothetical protein
MSITKLDTLGTREAFLEKRAVEKINEVVDQVNIPKKDVLTATFTEAGMAAAPGTITVTLTNQDGDKVDALVTFWGAATALGATTGTNIGNLSVSTKGELVKALTANECIMAVTEGGQLDVAVASETTDKFLNVAVGSQVWSHKFSVGA